MTFVEVVAECVLNRKFVEQFNRLTKCEFLVDNRAPIVKMIDEATGYQKEIDKKQHEYTQKFISFVFDTVWLRLKDVEKL